MVYLYTTLNFGSFLKIDRERFVQYIPKYLNLESSIWVCSMALIERVRKMVDSGGILGRSPRIYKCHLWCRTDKRVL